MHKPMHKPIKILLTAAAMVAAQAPLFAGADIKPLPKQPKRLIYFHGTHWDREWYFSFQRFRMNLVELADDMLAKFDDDRLGLFVFDGQSVVLEDICEIRPDFAPRLKKYIGDGKLKAGPWYTMPDELLSSGESIIRNFLYGKSTVEAFGGETWKVAYGCDIFGHIAQFPQIIDGFGMKTAVAGRGVCGKQFLKWQSPDGTSVNLLSYGKNGYGGYGRAMHGFAYAGKTPKLSKKEFAKRFANYVEKNIGAMPETFLLPDADDHTRIADNCDEELAWIKQLCPDSELVVTDYINLPEFDKPGLPVKKGELAETQSRDGYGAMRLVQNSISSRYDLKRANDESQTVLEWSAEPMLAARAFFEKPDKTKKSLLDLAWKTLLKNQAHDSICGCSVDEIHSVMKARYLEVRQIADGIEDDFLSRPTDGVKLRRAPKGKSELYKLDIFNPLPYARDEVLKLQIPFSTAFPKSFAEPRAQEKFNTFKIFDQRGNEIPYAILKTEKNQVVVYNGIVDIYTVALKAKLEPCAVSTFEIRASDELNRSAQSMRTGLLSADNGALAVSINRDGTFDVIEKASNKKYEGFNRFILSRDAGDGWYYVAPYGSPSLVSSSNASVKVVADTPILLEYEITKTLRFPKRLNYCATPEGRYAGTADSAEDAEITVKTTVSIEKNSPVLKVKTVVDNTASDYRMQLAFPTGQGGNYFSGQAFTMIERAAGCDAETLKKDEAKDASHNFNGIAGRGGAFFISKAGLHEVSCEKHNSSDILATLFRSFRRTYSTNGETDALLHGRLEFDYAYSFGTDDFSEIYRRAQKLRAGVKYKSIPIYQNVGELDVSKFLVKAEGDCVVSAIKPSQDGEKVVVRVFNPNSQPRKCVLKFGAAAKKIELCKLDETPTKLLSENSDAITHELSPNKIVTFIISK